MIKFKASSKSYNSMDDFKKCCFEKFELVKKELAAVLGFDCNITLDSFNPVFNKETIYLEAFKLSSKDFLFVMSLDETSSKFDKSSIGLASLVSVGMNSDFNLNSIELKHVVVGRIADNDRSYSGIHISYSVPEKCGNVIVKHSSDIYDGMAKENLTLNDTLVSIVNESTSVLHRLKEAVKNSEAILEPIK